MKEPNMRKKWIFLAPVALVGIALFVFLGGEIVKLLWNWLVPPLFGWREVTFWQALGLLVLCRILFGGSGFHRSRRSGPDFTPEQKERFRRRMREGWGIGSAETTEPGETA
jgi:hypothetical protein